MGGAIAHTCCQVTGPAAPSALTSPRHPPPASLFPLGLLHPGSLTAVWSYLKKKPANHKANKRPIRRRARAAGVPEASLQPVHRHAAPRPCLAPVPRGSPSPPPASSRYPAGRPTTATWVSGPTCAGADNSPADGRPTKYNSAHGSSRASRPRRVGQRREPSNGLRRGPPAPGRAAGGGQARFLRRKAPRRGQADAAIREVGFRVCFLNKTKGKPARGPSRAWGGAVSARGPGVRRAKPGGPTPPSAARCAPGPPLPGPAGEERGAGVRPAGSERRSPRGTYGAARRRRPRRGVRPAPSRPLACSLRAARWPARLLASRPTRRAPPSARLRCRGNWNQSPRPRDSHNAQRAARHIPFRPRASGHPLRATRAPRPCPPALRLRARRPSALRRRDVGRSVRGCTVAPGPGALPSGTPPGRWAPDAGSHPELSPWKGSVPAEAFLQRASPPLSRVTLSTYYVPGPKHGLFADLSQKPSH